MTGGSSASRMTSLLSREREIKEHEKLLAELEEKVADYGRRIERGHIVRAVVLSHVLLLLVVAGMSVPKPRWPP